MGARILVVDDSGTVRRVVERTLERAGYDVVCAADGREALERAQTYVPDLVLLDFVMPNMNGFQFSQAMRAVANLRQVPVVLMSAKADRIAEQFLSQTGAVDAISKPFGPEALLAVTANALARSESGVAWAPPPAEPAEGPPREPEAGAPTPPEPPPSEVDGTADAERLRAALETAKRLARGLGEVVRGLAPAERPSDERLARAIGEALAHEELFGLVRDLARLLPGESGEISFRGRIEHVPLGELLQMLQHQQQTGVLEIERSGEAGARGWIAICLREGLVDIALGHGSDDALRLGRLLLAEELIEREDLDMLLERRAGSKRLLGKQLVKLGYITPEDLRQALVRQTSELVYEALRWPSGTYRFARFATRPEATDARLGLPIASILMEGLRRVDEWRLIEEQIHDFDMVLRVRQDAVGALAPDALSREERQVLGAVDGERTVRQIVEESRMGSFDACKILFQLMTSGLVRAA